jgi:hypothetical protein
MGWTRDREGERVRGYARRRRSGGHGVRLQSCTSDVEPDDEGCLELVVLEGEGMNS